MSYAICYVYHTSGADLYRTEARPWPGTAEPSDSYLVEIKFEMLVDGTLVSQKMKIFS